VRAARQLGVPTSGSWVAAGFSQGGHAALFVGLMASRYAPELDFRGTVALAAPVHMPLLMRTVTADGSRPVSILTSYLLAGLPISHPEFDPSGLLTEQGGRLVELAATAPLLEVLRASRGLTNDHVGTTDLHDRVGIATAGQMSGAHGPVRSTRVPDRRRCRRGRASRGARAVCRRPPYRRHRG